MSPPPAAAADATAEPTPERDAAAAAAAEPPGPHRTVRVWPPEARPGPAPGRGRAKGPWLLCGLVCAFTVAGYGWSLRGNEPGFSVAQALYAACATVALLCLAATAAADPGFLPPSLSPDPQWEAVEAAGTSGEEQGWTLDLQGSWLRADGARYCQTCHIWRPHRAHHCSACGFCVARQDHHCPVLGTCVGARNHAPFAAFLLCACGGAAVLVAATSVRLYRMKCPWTAGCWLHWQMYVHAALLIPYASVLMLLGFATMHCWLVLCDVTTRDVLRVRRDALAGVGGAEGGAPACMMGGLSQHALGEVCCLRFRSRAAFEARWAAECAAADAGAAAGDDAAAAAAAAPAAD